MLCSNWIYHQTMDPADKVNFCCKGPTFIATKKRIHSFLQQTNGGRNKSLRRKRRSYVPVRKALFNALTLWILLMEQCSCVPSINAPDDKARKCVDEEHCKFVRKMRRIQPRLPARFKFVHHDNHLYAVWEDLCTIATCIPNNYNRSVNLSAWSRVPNILL